VILEVPNYPAHDAQAVQTVITRFSQSDSLRHRAHELIPGGCHTYAKGDDQYPVLAPGFIQRGLGSHVWDVDGNEYIEYGQGNRAVGLGHAYPEVVAAVQKQLSLGANFSRPSPIEVECAEQLLALVDGMDMVKFCKDGSDATTAAVKLARAHTGRDMVARCADHPFFATNDWFIGSTVLNSGIPEPIRKLTTTFPYGDIPALEQVFAEHPGQIAAVIMEPARTADPPPGYLQQVKEVCHRHGAVFILDEMITGFRWHHRGAQNLYGVVPDLTAFGKALANGFAVSALLGKRELMELGGLRHNRERVFLLSTTHGAETHALAAAIATMRIYEREPVIDALYRKGQRLLTEATQIIARHGLSQHVEVIGKPCCLVYATRDSEGQPSQAFRSLFLQETIRRGVLMASLAVSYTHTDEDISLTLDAIDGALAVYSRALQDDVGNFLVGRPSQVVYRRFNQDQGPQGYGVGLGKR
jgi:glutamate-1-semialdehyde 2,1-aminomutase